MQVRWLGRWQREWRTLRLWWLEITTLNGWQWCTRFILSFLRHEKLQSFCYYTSVCCDTPVAPISVSIKSCICCDCTYLLEHAYIFTQWDLGCFFFWMVSHSSARKLPIHFRFRLRDTRGHGALAELGLFSDFTPSHSVSPQVLPKIFWVVIARAFSICKKNTKICTHTSVKAQIWPPATRKHLKWQRGEYWLNNQASQYCISDQKTVKTTSRNSNIPDV